MKKYVSFFWFFIIYLLVKKTVIYHNHGEAVLAFALGLRLALVKQLQTQRRRGEKMCSP